MRREYDCGVKEHRVWEHGRGVRREYGCRVKGGTWVWCKDRTWLLCKKGTWLLCKKGTWLLSGAYAAGPAEGIIKWGGRN